ncbi:major facilitator superfamily domain-containing protein [Lipomyces tetrasporus]|uniref:Major facilitator superfamily domain-containing protein n=1 Tax=Lipomyces tetrasporus TaxID=54092 RepID=A0AAD7VR01_9ASCO|nr:major facilitator superfamily domain-containing protein [Lipomyces tetrasporus]KAJ8098109.1 major facilitator superfamily domain-containing protein [Lipomyces tetrasporus]
MDEKEMLETIPQSPFTKEADRASFQWKAKDCDVEIAVASTDDKKQSSQQEKDVNIIDWSGPDDPEMAVNWPAKRKWVIILLLSTLTLLTPFASSMFAPGIFLVMEEFHSTNVDLASFVVSVYLLGYAFGPLIIAPLSELYGRLPVYHIATILFIVFNVACARSVNLSMLIVFRFLAGLAGSCPLTVGPGSIADCFKQEERGKVMAIWTLPVLLGPTIGPVAGGYLSESLGWRWDFWFLIIVTSVIFILTLIFQRETYPPIILKRRVRRLRKLTDNQALRSALQSGKSPKELFLTSIVRPTKMLLFSPIILCLSIYTAVNYGFLYLLFTTMTEVFEDQYGISASNVGLTYLGIGVGQFSGLIAFGAVSDLMLKRKAKDGDLKPEYRLIPLLVGGFLVPIGLLLYGWTAEYKAHWIVPILGTVFVGMGMITIFVPVGTYLVDAFTAYAASATAANTVLRSLGGAFLPLCGTRMYDALGLGWGNTLLAFIALGLIPVIWIFLRYGEKIRTHPRFRLDL